MEVSPAGVASNPRYASVKGDKILIYSPTDDQPPPRQEGETVAISPLRQIRDGAGVRGREREQFDAGDDLVAIMAVHHHLH